MANGRRARHTYTSVGTYQAKVTVSDGEASASATVQIVVGNPAGNQPPTVQAAADPAGGGTAPVRIGFTAAGVDPDGDQLSYAWNFGDGGTAGGPKVSHVFTTPGAHVVTVTVKDPSGASADAQVTVQVAAARGAVGRRGRPGGEGGVPLGRLAVPAGVLQARPQGDDGVRGRQHRPGDARREPEGRAQAPPDRAAGSPPPPSGAARAARRRCA